MNHLQELLDTFNSVQGVQKRAFVANPAHSELDQMYSQLGQLAETLPPEQQQQISQQMDQMQSMGIAEQKQALTSLLSQLSQATQGGGAPQGDPSAQPQQGGQPPQGQGGQQGGQSAQSKQQDAAVNSNLAPGGKLDTTEVSLSLRELLDLVSGGKASMTHAKVKSIMQKSQIDADRLEQESQQSQQQMQMEQQMAQQQNQQAAAAQAPGQNLSGGGIYPMAPQQ